MVSYRMFFCHHFPFFWREQTSNTRICEDVFSADVLVIMIVSHVIMSCCFPLTRRLEVKNHKKLTSFSSLMENIKSAGPFGLQWTRARGEKPVNNQTETGKVRRLWMKTQTPWRSSLVPAPTLLFKGGPPYFLQVVMMSLVDLYWNTLNHLTPIWPKKTLESGANWVRRDDAVKCEDIFKLLVLW